MVGEVADAALALGDALRHVVDRARQFAELVLLAQLDAVVVPALADRARAFGQHRHRLGHAPGEHHAAGERHQEPPAGQRDQQQPQVVERRQRLVERLLQHRYHGRIVLGGERQHARLVLAIREVQRERLVPADDVGRQLLLQAVAQLRRQGGGDDRPLAGVGVGAQEAHVRRGDGAQLLHELLVHAEAHGDPRDRVGGVHRHHHELEHAIAEEHDRAGLTVELRDLGQARERERRGCSLRLQRIDQQQVVERHQHADVRADARAVVGKRRQDGIAVARGDGAAQGEITREDAHALHQSLAAGVEQPHERASADVQRFRDLRARVLGVDPVHGGEHGRQHQEEQPHEDDDDPALETAEGHGGASCTGSRRGRSRSVAACVGPG